MQYFELMARYDRRASFYHKAHIKETNKKIILVSYNTDILELDKETKKIKFLTKRKEDFSQTTNRHINEFLQQFTNEPAKSKSELLKMAGVTL